MELNETIVTRAIVERFYKKFMDNLELDVAIVGGGPAGLVAGYYLAVAKKKVALFERMLRVGGGMWGGGMMFNEIVVQEDAVHILKEMGVRHERFQDNYFTADSVEAISCIISKAVQAGLTIFNCVSVEDVVMRTDRITGLVINWSAVELAGLHVDPLTVSSKYVIDTTGHATEVVKVVERKVPGKLATPSGRIEGEKSLWADRAETLILENTAEVYPGLYVAGMAANTTFGGPRMGPIFGGMLLSGEKVCKQLLEKLQK